MNEIPDFGLSERQVLFLEEKFNWYVESDTDPSKCSKQQRIGYAFHMASPMLPNPEEIKFIGRWWSARTRYENGEHLEGSRKTQEQIEMLEEVLFGDIEQGNGPYPNPDTVSLLVQNTNLSRKQVQTWFQYRRKKLIEAGTLVITDEYYTIGKVPNFYFA